MNRFSLLSIVAVSVCFSGCDQGVEDEGVSEQLEVSEEFDVSEEALAQAASDEEELRRIEEFDAALEDYELEDIEQEDGLDSLPNGIDDFTSAVDPSDAGCLSTATWKDASNVYALMYNNCSYGIRVKVIWARATDSQCYFINPRTQAISARGHRHRPDPYVSAYQAC